MAEQATPEGLKQARDRFRRFNSQQVLADRAQVSRDTVRKFFAQKPISVDRFKAICKELDLNWEEIAGLSQAVPEPTRPESSDSKEVDALVQQIRETIRPHVKERCGTMRVLNMTQPIDLKDIYTSVNILEKPTANQRLEIQELLERCRIKNTKAFNRFGLGRIIEKRILGWEAVEKHSKLMVLGRPGAGKTTFLKYLAIRCLAGELFPNYLPIFVPLKEFAEAEGKPSLLGYLEQLIPNQSSRPSRDVLDAGRALILLDGLDEVREEDSHRINQQIRAFAEHFHQARIVLTCRIAAKFYTFEQFTEVEVADFNRQQIEAFVQKWFREKKPEKAIKFLERLEENKPIKELANNPLLLTLLCLIFEEKNKFKENRAELYGEGIELLLEKWDNSRDVERDQVYQNLSTQRKEDMLSKLALATFATGDYFFKRREAEHHISEYIRNLPQANSEKLEVDSKQVLRSITAQHGLLIERAVDIYSFSHLTFHEYFTAREITLNAQFEILVQHITEKQWREVFLLTASMLRNANELMRLIKTQINQLLTGDETLQQFLQWVQQKSSSVDAPYEPAAIRAFYLDLARPRVHSLTRALTRAYVDPERDRDLARVLDLDLALTRTLALDPNYALDRALDLDFARTLDLELAHALDRALSLDLSHNHVLDLDRALSLAHDHQLEHKLQELRDELSDTSPENREQFRQWWKANSQAWTDKLRSAMTKHRNIGHDWQFTKEQRRLLQQYYDANKLLVDCLNSDCYVSREVRQEIEETLLLPIAEIERRKKEKE